MGLRDTQERMQDTKDRLDMAWLHLNLLQTDVPSVVFQTWLERATSPPTASPISSGSPRNRRVMTTMSWRPRLPRDSIGSPDSQLHEKYVQFLGFISIIHVHQLTLNRYQTNLALLKEEMKLVESLLEPLHRVPPEILLKIFLCAVEGSEMERRERSVERGEHPEAKAWPAPFALAAVCRYWRDLVCSNSRLWKYLVLDVRDKKEYYSTPIPMIHERIRQHLKYSHKLPLDITIIAWGDHLRENIVPMILPLLQAGNLARERKTGGTGLGRVELVTGGRNDIDARYTEILEGLPPAQHLALVRVWQANTEIRVPASFCAQLTRIEAYDAVFRLEEACPSVTEATLFKTDRVRIRTLLDRTPNLGRLTIDGLRYADTGSYSPLAVGTMCRLHTIALRITDLNAYQTCFKLAPTIQLPALRRLILLNMPDMILSDEWSGFIGTNGQHVDEVEVRAITAHARRLEQPPAYLAHLSRLPALTSLRLVGDCARYILGAMASQPISRATQCAPGLSGITQIRVINCALPRRALLLCGWSNVNPSEPWVWRRANAKDIKVTLERVRVEDVHVAERSFTN